IQLNGEAFEVIGVLPPKFRYPTKDFDLLAPLFIPPDQLRSWGYFYYKAVGRLKPGVSVQQAQAEASTISERLARPLPRGRGAGAGVLLAWWLLKILVRWLPPQLPGLDSIGLHGPVLVLALLLSVLVVLLAGMLPARLASRVRLTETIQQGSRTIVSGGRIRN